MHLVGVNLPARRDKPGRHAATLSVVKPGEIHGMKCYVLENADGTLAAITGSIALAWTTRRARSTAHLSGDIGRVDYQSVDDKECLNVSRTLSRGGHHPGAGKCARRGLGHARSVGSRQDQHILVNSGRGDRMPIT